MRLPLWEYQSLLEEYYKIDAHKTLNQLYAVASGFNGGEGFEKLERALRSRIESNLIEDVEDELDENITLEELIGISIPSI